LKAGFRFATESEIVAHFGTKPGYLGPIGVKNVKVIADRTVANMSDFVCGANEAGFHIKGVNWGRDLPEPDQVADLRNVVEGDPSPDGRGVLAIQRGIEVGHVFYLGTKYSKAMNATFLDEDGKPKHFEMGCYGIGVSSIVAAAIEQGNDERGMIQPLPRSRHSRSASCRWAISRAMQSRQRPTSSTPTSSRPASTWC